MGLQKAPGGIGPDGQPHAHPDMLDYTRPEFSDQFRSLGILTAE